MTDRSESLLAELLDVQKRVLANQEAALEQQRVATARYQRTVRLVMTLVLIVMAAILLPYAWQWVTFISAQ